MKYLALPLMLFSICLAQESTPAGAEAPAPEPAAPQATEETATTEGPAATEQAADEQAPANEISETLATAAKPHLEVARRHIEMLKSLGKLLKGVADVDTANAVANDVDALAQQVKATMEQEQALPEPSPEIQYLVTAEMANYDLEELTNDSIGRALELQESEPPCFGSGALEQALNALLSLYLQEDDEEPVPDMAQ